MTRAYLLSFLSRQLLVLKEGFASKYPNPWLVWEPGSWRAPPQNAAVAETRLPASAERQQRAAPGDALCFELDAKVSKKGPMRIGRSEESELLISDATVSREHCVLRREGDAWFIKASSTVKSMKLDGKPLSAGTEAKLASGQQLDLGDVKLTFLDPKPFEQRVQTVAAKL